MLELVYKAIPKTKIFVASKLKLIINIFKVDSIKVVAIVTKINCVNPEIFVILTVKL